MRRLTMLCLLLLTGAACASNAPRPAPGDIQVQNIRGTLVRPLDVPGRTATVLIFIAHDCPISNSYSAEVQRLRSDYGASHIAFYVVYTDVGVPLATLQAHARGHDYTPFALVDSHHALVKLTGAVVTPEAVVLGPADKILYEGRIDNRYSDFGKSLDVASVSDLRRALDAVRAGQPVKVSRTKAVGCYIPSAS